MRAKDTKRRRTPPVTAKLETQYETISATVPRDVVEAAKEAAGNRGFSAFVATAISRELLRRRREELIDEFEAEWGKIPESKIRAMAKVLET